MATRMLPGTLTGIAIAISLAWSAPVLASANDSCDDFAPAACGDAIGDGLCADPLQDCVDVGNGVCGCRPRVCCDCDSASGAQISACNLPCTETGIGLLACVSLCVLVDSPSTPCELNIVNRATCTGDSCPTTGCCTFNESNARTVSQNICVETDADTCGLLGGLVSFTEGGTCVDGVFGTCTAPTPTSTPTNTATSTYTATVTNTPTASTTPTNTLIPDGGDCDTPSECESTFCVDGVCCETICDGPFEVCNDPLNPGVCSEIAAPAPAMSNNNLLIALGLLLAIGTLALFYRRHS